MSNLTIQDCGVIVASLATVCGAIAWLIRLIKNKVKPANIRANFFKNAKSSWTLRIYNASDSDIEALNIKVSYPDYDGFITDWKCESDLFPSLKSKAKFDIRVMLCTSAPDTLPITISWQQGKKEFKTVETVQLRD